MPRWDRPYRKNTRPTSRVSSCGALSHAAADSVGADASTACIKPLGRDVFPSRSEMLSEPTDSRVGIRAHRTAPRMQSRRRSCRPQGDGLSAPYTASVRARAVGIGSSAHKGRAFELGMSLRSSSSTRDMRTMMTRICSTPKRCRIMQEHWGHVRLCCAASPHRMTPRSWPRCKG